MVLLDHLADCRRGPHFGEHIERIGVGAERHVDAGIEVALKAFQRAAAPREGKWRMRDRGFALGEQSEVIAVGIGYRAVAGDIKTMRKDCAGAEEAFRSKKADGGMTGLANRFMEFRKLLGAMQRQTDAERFGDVARMAAYFLV